jgi:cell division initiation protein
MFETENPSPTTPNLTTRRERIVRNTPLDLRQRRFSSAMRGFDREQVITFLADVADDYEQVLQQLDLNHQELLRLEGILHEHRLREDNLRNTLLTVQKLADEIREAAQHEAKIIVREAEARADLLLEKTQSRLEDVEREIIELRLKRRNVENGIEASISALHHALEFIRAQDKPEREERILLHRPRQTEPASAPRLTDAAPEVSAERRVESDS